MHGDNCKDIEIVHIIKKDFYSSETQQSAKQYTFSK